MPGGGAAAAAGLTQFGFVYWGIFPPYPGGEVTRFDRDDLRRRWECDGISHFRAGIKRSIVGKVPACGVDIKVPLVKTSSHIKPGKHIFICPLCDSCPQPGQASHFFVQYNCLIWPQNGATQLHR